MHFVDPKWLLAGLVTVTALALLLVRAEVLRTRALQLLERARLNFRSGAPSGPRRWLRLSLAIVAVAAGFVALARPQKGLHWETLDRKGTDFMLVVDTSRSMDADDVKPTRLDRTKLAIRDLVERFPGDRVGLVAFAGDAFVESPMTLDHAALLESVDALDTGTVARGGTDVGRGIDVAAAALATEPGQQKIMVLLTDGEDLEGQGVEQATAAAAAGITVDTVGVGTASGELVPIVDAHGKATGIVRDESGQPVRSHLDEASLKAVAEAGHGAYRALGQDGRGLDQLYDESLAALAHVEASSRTRRVYADWFEVPLALSLLALLLEALVERRWTRLGAVSIQRAQKRGALAALAMTALIALPGVANASVAGAAKAYAEGKFGDAAAEFERQSEAAPKDARLAYNAGDAAYRAGQLEVADAAFKRTIALKNPALAEHALYNEGDVLFRLGQAKGAEDRAATIAVWKASIASYDAALGIDAKDADAKWNRDFVARKLKDLEEKKPDEETKQPDDKKDDQSDDHAKKPEGSKGGAGQNSGNDPTGKDSKSGSGAKATSKSGSGNPAAGHDSNGEGDKGTAKEASNGRGESASLDKGAKQDAPAGVGANGKSPAAPRPAGEGADGTKGGGQGRSPSLSPHDARALLGALRGDERHGRASASGEAAADDEPPRKDW